MSNQNVFSVTLDRSYPDSDASAFQDKLDSWLLEPFILIVFDFEKTKQFDLKVKQAFLRFARTLKDNKKYLASLNMSPQLKKDLDREGLLDRFNPCPNIEVAKMKAKCEAPKIVFLRHFVKASLRSFKVQGSLTLKLTSLSPVTDSDHSEWIGAEISVASSALSGHLYLLTEPSVFRAIYKNMFGEELEIIEDDDKDVVCELLNILFGLSKTTLVDEYNYDLKPAIPQLIKPQQFEKSSLLAVFESQFGKIHLIMSENNKTQKAQAA